MPGLRIDRSIAREPPSESPETTGWVVIKRKVSDRGFIVEEYGAILEDLGVHNSGTVYRSLRLSMVLELGDNSAERSREPRSQRECNAGLTVA